MSWKTSCDHGKKKKASFWTIFIFSFWHTFDTHLLFSISSSFRSIRLRVSSLSPTSTNFAFSSHEVERRASFSPKYSKVLQREQQEQQEQQQREQQQRHTLSPPTTPTPTTSPITREQAQYPSTQSLTERFSPTATVTVRTRKKERPPQNVFSRLSDASTFTGTRDFSTFFFSSSSFSSLLLLLFLFSFPP